MAEIKIEVRSIDLERLGISLCFINTDSAARKDVALQNAKRLADAFASPPVAVQEEGDATKLLKDLRWRLDDIRDMLMKEGFNGDRIYGCDEWSTPTVNLATAIGVIDKALAAMKGDQP